jgi:hypothetical protein
MMANPYKESDNKKKVAPGGEHEPKPKKKETVVKPQVVEPPKPQENLLAGMIEEKQRGKTHAFYLSHEASEKLEKLAKQNKCNKSKALDTLLRSLL